MDPQHQTNIFALEITFVYNYGDQVIIIKLVRHFCTWKSPSAIWTVIMYIAYIPIWAKLCQLYAMENVIESDPLNIAPDISRLVGRFNER